MAEALRLAASRAGPWPNPPVERSSCATARSWAAARTTGRGPAHAEVVALREAGAWRAAPRSTARSSRAITRGARRRARRPSSAAASRGSSSACATPTPRCAGGGLEMPARRRPRASRLACAPREALELIWPFVGHRRLRASLRRAEDRRRRWTAASRRPRPPPSRGAGLPDGRRSPPRRARPAALVRRGAGRRAHDLPADRPTPRRAASSRRTTSARRAIRCRATWTPTSAPDGLRGPGGAHLVFAARREAAPAAAHVAAPSGSAARRWCVECDGRDGHGSTRFRSSQACPRLGAHTLLVEGGPRSPPSFLARGLVDRWVSASSAPVVLGGGPTLARLHGERSPDSISSPRWPETESGTALSR